MDLLPIVAQAEAHAEIIPPDEWDEDNTPADIWHFHENLVTSSNDFWYCLNNGYIGLELITAMPLGEITVEELLEVQRIVEEYGFKF